MLRVLNRLDLIAGIDFSIAILLNMRKESG